MKILLDVDDTLNRFSDTALSYFCGREINIEDFPHPGSYDLVSAAATLSKQPGLTKQEFWDYFPRDFWASLPKSDEFDMILEFAESHGRENVCIVTAPTIDPLCLAGKLDWIHSNLPDWLHRQFLMGPRKHFCARPDAVLVDDADKNVTAFRAHGGNAILVPRPWNSNHDFVTSEFLRAVFPVYPSDADIERVVRDRGVRSTFRQRTALR